MTGILDLNQRVGLVTGAGQGIGRQIALHFAAHNAGGVVVNDFVRERAEAVAEEVRAAGGKALALQADVSDHAGVKEMVAKATEAFGHVDILVNNAGNAGASPNREMAKPFWETGPEVWNGYINVNFYGVLNCTAAVIPGMIAGQYGRIISVISDAGRHGDARDEIYAGAKAGAAGFMRSVARTLGRYQIAANCVAIAATVTPATEKRLRADPERFKKIMESYVIRRPGESQDVANMVLFLAAEQNSWITGQTYAVNGGYTFSL